MKIAPILTALAIALVGALGAPALAAQAAPSERVERPVELGAPRWGRDLEVARERSAASGRPIVVLFTEVPGCSTVRAFAEGPLRHPLIVEAIETEFVPIVIYNNRSGADAAILERFGEPSWNNPIVRVLDQDLETLGDRFAGPYTSAALATALVRGLRAASRPVPRYLAALERELASAGRTKTATLSMYCFWSGEAKLGDIDGVVATRPGHQAGREVVEVIYDPRYTSYDALLAEAKRRGAATGALARGGAELEAARAQMGQGAKALGGSAFRHAPGDDKKQLAGTPWAKIAMTPGQRARVNALVGRGEDPAHLLSPRQRALLDEGHVEVLNVPRPDPAPAPSIGRPRPEEGPLDGATGIIENAASFSFQ